MSSYERIYASPLHDPLFFWLAAALFVAVLAARLPFLAGFLVTFVFVTVADALATGALSPVPKGASWGTPLAVAFVILGDFRYFLLVERYAVKGRSLGRIFGVAAAWAFVVPVVSYALRNVVPSLAAPVRVTFLTYELLFLGLAIVLRAAVLPRRTAGAAPEVRRWLLEVTVFEVVQYTLWASADVAILSGIEAGFLWRLLPNAMYYAAFLPFVLARAPAAERTWR
ncbi:MAG: hypothetical protein R3B70_00840 [Polyangiaceae bacterium]